MCCLPKYFSTIFTGIFLSFVKTNMSSSLIPVIRILIHITYVQMVGLYTIGMTASGIARCKMALGRKNPGVTKLFRIYQYIYKLLFVYISSLCLIFEYAAFLRFLGFRMATLHK